MFFFLQKSIFWYELYELYDKTEERMNQQLMKEKFPLFFFFFFKRKGKRRNGEGEGNGKEWEGEWKIDLYANEIDTSLALDTNK